MRNGWTATGRIEQGHDVGATAEGAQRESSPDQLAEAGEVGGDPEVILPAAHGNPKTHYLVEDEDDAETAGCFPEHLEIAPFGRDHPRRAEHRLHDNRSQPLPFR